MVNSDQPGNTSNGPPMDNNTSKYEGSYVFGISKDDKAQSSKGLPPLCVTSDEINYLVYRYLQESGFVHTAFTFAYESLLGKSPVRNVDVPPGALISFLQKGLQYLGIEENLNEDGSEKQRKKRRVNKKNAEEEDGNGAANETSDFFSLLSPVACKALAKRDPPIRLNVPPTSAAAAIKAKVEAERQPEENLNLGKGKRPNAEIEAVASTQEVKKPINEIEAQISAAHQRQQAISLLQQAQFQSLNIPSSLQQPNASAAAAVAAAAAMSQLHRGKNPAASPQPQEKEEEALPQSPESKTKKEPKKGRKNKVKAKEQESHQNAWSLLDEAALRLEAKQAEKEEETPTPAPLAINGQQPALIPSLGSVLGNKMMHPLMKALGTGSGALADHATAVLVAAHNANMKTQPTLPAVRPTVEEPPPPVQSMSKPVSNEDELDDSSTLASPSEVLELNKHTSEVFMCAWNHVHTNLIATGSGDASARIWCMSGPYAKSGYSSCRLLQHGSPGDRNKDVTTLEWSSDGELLATGSYDGIARVWRRGGTILHTLRCHRGPIFSLKWNKKGNFLLSGSYDKSTIVWDVSGEVGYVKQQFSHHFAPALDVDWKDDLTFASCSTDRSVHVCRVGSQHPLQTYCGHNDEVNAVKWSPSGKLLASCSDDCTAKIWDVDSDRKEPLHDLKSHMQEIYTVKWSPTGPGSPNPNKPMMLATASFDGSVRLWNMHSGSCIRVLSRHRDSVYSVAFSPSGEYLASGSLAGQLYIWNVMEGRHVLSYKGKGDIFEVAWNSEETRVAACFSSNVVAVIDFKP